MHPLPRIFYYNPTCEMAVGNGLPHYQAPALVSTLENDLSFLMSYLASADDWVLVNNIPSDVFLQAIKHAGFDLPRLLLKDDFFNSERFLKTKKESFEPWGISPAVLQKVKSHFNSFSDKYKRSLVAIWQEAHRDLFGRAQALDVLNGILKLNTNLSLIRNSQLPEICKSVWEVEAYISKHQKVMLKAPWSSSGRGILRLEKPDLNASNIQWIEGTVASQGYVMVEALLDKCIDFSFHFQIDEYGLESIGATTFLAGKNGQYQGSYLELIPAELDEAYGDFYNEAKIYQVQELVANALRNSAIPQLYRGVLGVDAMVYKDEAGELRIQPCVEINLRRNMGTITLALRKKFPDRLGYWQTVFVPKGKLSQRKVLLEKEHPPLYEAGKLSKGFLALSEMQSNRTFASYLILQ